MFTMITRDFVINMAHVRPTARCSRERPAIGGRALWDSGRALWNSGIA